MLITFKQLKNELMLDGYKTADIGIFAMDKNSILYRGLHYWGQRFHVNLKHCWTVHAENTNFIWIDLPLPLNQKQFSHYVLNDTVSYKWHDFATPYFVKYVNNRKTLYGIHLFRVFHNLTTDMHIPHHQSNRFYTQLRLHGIMKNMVNGWLHVDYDHLPLSMTNKFGKAPSSKGEVLYRLAFEFPYLFISKNSLMWHWIKAWYASQNKDINKCICGLQVTKHYVFMGMSDIRSHDKILSAKMLKKPRHPQEYSGIDYYAFQGNSNGVHARHFIDWIKKSIGASRKSHKHHDQQLSLKLD